MSEFKFHNLDNSEGEAKELLTTINGAYGFVPNLFAYMAAAPATIKAYMQLNTLLEEISIPMPQTQVALLAVSKTNGCEFCRVAHSAIGKGKGANQQTIDAINNGTEVDDPLDRAIINLVLSMVENRGWVSDEDREAFYAAGFNQQQYLECVLIVTIKTLSNYSNHVTKPEPNAELLNML